MSSQQVITDWNLLTSYWDIEGNRLAVHAVSVFHPTVQFGIEYDFYKEITDAELYGTIRSWRPSSMLVTPTDPIMIILGYNLRDEPDFFTITHDMYRNFQIYYVGSGIKTNTDWQKEGF